MTASVTTSAEEVGRIRWGKSWDKIDIKVSISREQMCCTMFILSSSLMTSEAFKSVFAAMAEKLLKIADFGLSVHLIAAVSSGASPEKTTDESDRTNLLALSRLRRLVRLSDRPIMSP
ncbi:hypothetical protein PsorP6_003111 [Peronosclerospora sorghi]|uniref:Uncharacterized protein n=1 Tax=Peronosclerospora sorghi TaxID=230839 RepID=A0ACC0VNC5_9STRA|nr:hypothetical protein PsorP6_003111 [Peronosclerospora sorghi]